MFLMLTMIETMVVTAIPTKMAQINQQDQAISQSTANTAAKSIKLPTRRSGGMRKISARRSRKQRRKP
jgi:hypothetical protein